MLKRRLHEPCLVVALRKESVDRNHAADISTRREANVALRKESVDRNDAMQVVVVIMYASLSARRAWIEIKYVVKDSDFAGSSLSARRAWIEILSSKYAL